MKHPEPASNSRDNSKFYRFMLVNNGKLVTPFRINQSRLTVVVIAILTVVLLLIPADQLLLFSPSSIQDQNSSNNNNSNAYATHFDPSKISEAEINGWHYFETKDNINDDNFDKPQKNIFNPIADLAYYYNLTQYSYVLYYGGFDSAVTSSILSVKPTLLITNYYAMDHHTRELFAENNVTIIAYLPITWTHRDIESTLSDAYQLLADGADGIFIDEAVTMSNDWEFWYHAQIYKAVKDYDEDKIVIINPGTASINEKSMLVADIICFEHEWRSFRDVEWALDYPGWRFMGISSNEFYRVMGYYVDKDSAYQDLEESRHMNIAYHYSADHYIWLPPWLDVYGGITGSPHPVIDYSQYLDFESIDYTERPASYYPVVDTETGQVGNKYNATVVEEVPDEEEIIEENENDTEVTDDEEKDDNEQEEDPADQQQEPSNGQQDEEDKEEPSASDSEIDDNDDDDNNNSNNEENNKDDDSDNEGNTATEEEINSEEGDEDDSSNKNSNTTDISNNSTSEDNNGNNANKVVDNSTSLDNDDLVIEQDNQGITKDEEVIENGTS